MRTPLIVILGPVGTRWLFAVIVVSALLAWSSETALGVIEPSDRIAYPLITLTFGSLALLVWRQPQKLRLWQRTGVTLLALYFSLTMLVFTLRPDPGPSMYTLGSFTPWAMGGNLLLFTTWRAREALMISLGLLALTLAPPALLRFTGTPPHWLLDGWPLIANLALCQTMDQLAPGPVERLPQIKVPTLILWGERDRLIPLRWGREFEKAIPGSRLVVFPKLGHVPQEEDPAATLAALRDWLPQVAR